MHPTFQTGDLLTVEPCGFTDIGVGDLVVFENRLPQRDIWFIAHRVLEKSEGPQGPFLVVRGDAPNQSKKMFVASHEVLGKVIHIERKKRLATFFKLFHKRRGIRKLKGGLVATYKKHPGMVARKIMDEVILVPIQKNVANMQSIFSLNPMGAKVWELIDGKNTEENIAKVLSEEHEVSPALVRKDLSILISQLKEIGAIEA